MSKEPNWTRLERERQRKDEALYESQLVEPVDYIELNMCNYDDDDVAQLNEWAMWAFRHIDANQANKDAETLALRVIGEHPDTCSPETIAAVSRVDWDSLPIHLPEAWQMVIDKQNEDQGER